MAIEASEKGWILQINNIFKPLNTNTENVFTTDQIREMFLVVAYSISDNKQSFEIPLAVFNQVSEIIFSATSETMELFLNREGFNIENGRIELNTKEILNINGCINPA
jgi:hypothetical protein